jgi:hypothetical protein
MFSFFIANGTEQEEQFFIETNSNTEFNMDKNSGEDLNAYSIDDLKV